MKRLSKPNLLVIPEGEKKLLFYLLKFNTLIDAYHIVSILKAILEGGKKNYKQFE